MNDTGKFKALETEMILCILFFHVCVLLGLGATSVLRPSLLEKELEGVVLGVGVPVGPELAVGAVNVFGLDPEANGLVGLSGHEEVLVVLGGRLDFLLKGGHESVQGLDVFGNLRVLDLEEEAQLVGGRVADLCDLVPGLSDLEGILLDLDLGGGGLRGEGDVRVPGLFHGTTGEVGLVLLALGVGQVRALVGMEGQTELALVRAQMVLHEVRVSRKVNGLQGELP
jgi:hypothetical protein